MQISSQLRNIPVCERSDTCHPRQNYALYSDSKLCLLWRFVIYKRGMVIVLQIPLQFIITEKMFKIYYLRFPSMMYDWQMRLHTTMNCTLILPKYHCKRRRHLIVRSGYSRCNYTFSPIYFNWQHFVQRWYTTQLPHVMLVYWRSLKYGVFYCTRNFDMYVHIHHLTVTKPRAVFWINFVRMPNNPNIDFVLL